MRPRVLPTALLVLPLLLLVGGLIGCAEDDSSSPTDPGDATFHADSEADCAGCHTNLDMLKATVEEDGDDAPPSSGEG